MKIITLIEMGCRDVGSVLNRIVVVVFSNTVEEFIQKLKCCVSRSIHSARHNEMPKHKLAQNVQVDRGEKRRSCRKDYSPVFQT